MMLRAVNHHLVLKKVAGCTAVIEQLFHRIADTGVRETMIVVYAPTGGNLTVLRKSLGFDRGKTEVKVEVRGIIFQGVQDAMHVKGKGIPDWGGRHKLHATLGNVDTEAAEQLINDTIIAAFGLHNVDYWVTKQMNRFKGTAVIVGLVQGFEPSRVDPVPLRAILIKDNERLQLDFDTPLPRRNVGQYAKVTHIGQLTGHSPPSWSSGSRGSGRTSGSDGGRGIQGRNYGSQR
jgi:hypothetical protein